MDMNEMEKKNYLSMWNGRRGAERNPSNYQRRDDGNHIYKSTDYYEWWYVDASFDNGYHLVVTFHYMNAFLRPIVPSIQLMVYKPDGTQTARYDLCDEKDIYACPDYCDVRMGEAWLKDAGATYEMYIKIKGVGARLSLKPVVPGWKPGTGLLYHDEAQGAIGGWVVAVPYAEVTGELYLKEETIPVRGACYHDHNWGNKAQFDIFAGWYWGRIHNDKYIIDYGWVIPRAQEAPVVSPLLIARPGEIVLSTDRMETKLEEMVRDEKTGRDYARKLVITTDTEGVKMTLTLDTTRKIETMQLPKIADWNQYYYRFLANYTMDVEVDGRRDVVSGQMLHELMYL
jgi:predicted secreted hydrolase